MLRPLLDPVLSLVYPQHCLSCGDQVDSLGDGFACSACWATTKIFDGCDNLCGKCGAYSMDGREITSKNCRQCSDAFFDFAAALGVYEKALAATVIGLKRAPYIPTRVREILTPALKQVLAGGDVAIIPVPLSKRRRLERGYNQAEVIAKHIAQATDHPIVHNALVRTEHSPIHRIGMDKRAREQTVMNAFRVRFPRLVDGHDVILVDDVLTSGATASSCAKALKKSGAKSVRIFTLARAVIYK